MKYTVVTFYKFSSINDIDSMKTTLLNHMVLHHVKGTIILAPEGINGTICAEEKNILSTCELIRRFENFSDISFKQSYCDFNPFDKAKIKLRPEAVTMGLSDIDPNIVTGEHLSPEAWNQLIQEDNVLIIDTRNDYECELGAFKGAINPKTDNFRDFPEFVENYLNQHKDKKIAMYCTGGVRCEKSTAYLKTLGFKQVYQLDGGILNYLKTIELKDSLWEGSCFVFDNRIAVDHQLKSLEQGSIDKEWKNNYKTQDTQKI